jgi:hypothetical protein
VERRGFIGHLMALAGVFAIPPRSLSTERTENNEHATDTIVETTGNEGLPYDPETGFPIGTIKRFCGCGHPIELDYTGRPACLRCWPDMAPRSPTTKETP